MDLWAAIDLMRGSAVTLVQGKAEQKTVWKDEPVEFARRWEDEGADGIHLVDLDAAFATGDNADTISQIIGSVDIPVEVGGGIRTKELAESWLHKGASRVVIGTMAYRQPEALEGLLSSSGAEKVVVAADYKDGVVVTKGWKEGQGISVLAAAQMFEKAGVRYLLSTCVGRDGMASGPDVEMVKKLVTETRMGIIASGGIRDSNDLLQLQKEGARGAIIGRALYAGSIGLADARRRLA